MEYNKDAINTYLRLTDNGRIKDMVGEKNRSGYSIGKSVILEHKKGDSLFSKAGVISAPTGNTESPLDELSITGDILSVKDRKANAKRQRTKEHGEVFLEM